MPRKEEYRRLDGSLSRSRKDAILISPYTVECFARAVTGNALDPRYFVGTAYKETNFAANEIDTEDSGFVSKGLYQISEEENRIANGVRRVELLDPIQSTLTLYRLTVARLKRCEAAGFIRYPDIYAYLGVCHNEGDAAGPRSIAKWGCDWPEYKRRNLESAQRMLANAITIEEKALAAKEMDRVRRISAYGDAMITGGLRFGEK